MILNLPMLNGHVAGQTQAAEQTLLQERALKAQEFHRDTVEIVAETGKTEHPEPLKAEPDDRRRARYEPTFKKRTGNPGKDDDFLRPAGLIIDRRV
jgi:hypothetical protein